MIYSFDIDEKSLFRGIKNDYVKGQSATVHTPLNQAKDSKKWRNKIYEFLEGCLSKNIDNLPKVLNEKCLRKTTSKAEGVIVYFYVFSNFAVDNIPFDVDTSFAMYVKEETSHTITKRDGNSSGNTHIGRQKLHYPISLSHFSDGFNIDNRKVLDKILEINGGFAYVVNGFEIDSETMTLNFKTTMVGLDGVLLSNVFKRKKGVGAKLLVNGILDKIGIISSAKTELTIQEQNSFVATLEKIQESSRSNGKIGEESVVKDITTILKTGSVKDLVHVSKKYPQSPYDIECVVNGVKMYIEVKSTQSDKKIFYMSKGERQFMDKYYENYLLIVVTNVKSNRRRYSEYRREDIMNTKNVRQELQDIKFIIGQ